LAVGSHNESAAGDPAAPPTPFARLAGHVRLSVDGTTSAGWTLAGDTRAWASGYAFDDGGQPLLQAELAQAVQDALAAADVSAALRGLNGSYWAVLQAADGSRITIVTDRIGTCPLYYTLASGRLVISDDFWAVCAALKRPTLSRTAAIELLTFDYALEQATLVEEIQECPPGSMLVFECDKADSPFHLARETRYWRYDITPEVRPADQMINGLGEVFDEVRRRTGHLLDALEAQAVGVNLTAGGDSRLLACLLHGTGKPVQCYTSAWVPAENATALRVSQLLGVPHAFLPLWALRGEEPDARVFWALAPTTKYSVANHSLGLATYGTPGVDVLASGHLGDMLAGSHLNIVNYMGRDKPRAAIAESAARQHVRWSPDILRTVLRPDAAGEASAGLAHYARLIADSHATHELAASLVVDLEQRQRRFILRDYLAQRQYAASILVLNDYAFQDFAQTVPFEWQLATSLYFSTLVERVFVERYAPLKHVPLNGVLPKRVGNPVLAGALHYWRKGTRYVGRRAVARLPKILRGRAADDGTLTDRTFWQRELVQRGLPELEWLVDVDATRRLLDRHAGEDCCVRSWAWSLYTLARVSQRVQTGAST
jgi:asparagine synthetase B (glutamine-hydrolysing)